MKSFGERLGAVWALLGVFLAFLARSGALLGRLLGFMGASDLILGGFGEDLGGILRGFGGFATVLEHFGKICFHFLNWDPRAASLRPAERHNFVDFFKTVSFEKNFLKQKKRVFANNFLGGWKKCLTL